LKEQGTTIILSTHNMTSVEEICNDIVLINKSQKVLEGNVAELRQQYKTHQFNVEIDRTDIEIPENFGFKILTQKEEYNHTHLTLQLSSEYNSNQLLTQLMPYGNITNFQEILPSMNEIFIQAVNENRK
jgi:ABC-2 type transport system ATP-binding protein